MYRTVIICPDRGLTKRLEDALGDVSFSDLGRILRTVDHYPEPEELKHIIRALAPDILFVSMEAGNQAVAVSKIVEQEGQGVQLVAFSREAEPGLMLEAMRAGLREFLVMPFPKHQLEETLARVTGQLEKKPASFSSTDELFSFLPAKAGVGASTVAVNFCGSISRRANMPTLLSDFDLNSGMLRFMMKLENQYSVIDAAARSNGLDEHLWPQIVTGRGNLHLIHAGPLNPQARLDGNQIHLLVDFMRRNYKVVGFDLSGNLERYSIELMEQSRRIVLVTTPEVSAMHLAREKVEFLRGFGLGKRVALVVNRYPKHHPLTPEQISDIVDVPVVATLPNDYRGVTSALSKGTFVDSKSELGRSYTALANSILENPVGDEEPKKKFLEFFSVMPKSLVPVKR